MNLAHNAQKKGNVCVFAQIFHDNARKAVKSTEIDFLIISCLFPIGRVGTYRQVLHLVIKTITVCRKLQDKVYCN